LLSDDPEDVKDWELQISDKKGRVLKSFKGQGALPPSLSWDGKNEKGLLQDAEGLSYSLRTTAESGAHSEKKSLLAMGGPAAASLGVAGDLGLQGSDFGLRGAEGSGQAKSHFSRVKPSLRGNADFKLKGAQFDLSDVSEGTKSWELRIVDDQGKVVRKFSGKGAPPKSLNWEGGNDLGQPLDLGLGGGYVLRTEDASGQTTERGDDLVQPDDFARIAKSRPLPSLNTSHPSLYCRKDGKGGYLCVAPFGPGSPELGDKAWGAVGEAVALLGKTKLSNIEISGYAGEGDGAVSYRAKLSQGRAEAVMKVILEGYEARTDGVSVKGLGDSPKGHVVEIHLIHRMGTKE
jgi:hypothetical protein